MCLDYSEKKNLHTHIAVTTVWRKLLWVGKGFTHRVSRVYYTVYIMYLRRQQREASSIDENENL